MLIKDIILLISITGCISSDLTTPAVDTTENEYVFSLDATENIPSFDASGVPKDCSQREKLKNQPVGDNDSSLRKCCPIGEGLNTIGDEQNHHQCDTTNHEFNPTIINAVLFDNCIEDIENSISIPTKIGIPCNMSIVYTDEVDLLFVLQDGSLLIMDQFANISYTRELSYCLDIDNVSGITYAIVCISSVEEHIKHGQIMTVAVLMLVSVPCLFFVSYLHVAIKSLRTLHGLSLSVMSFCLATGYLLHSLVHISSLNNTKIGYMVQFFILSYFFWFFCLSCNVFINIWLKIPRNKPPSKLITYLNYAAYWVISFTGALILVWTTITKGFPGMPSYFLQGVTESIRESQRYFIPPISALLFISFFVMAGSFFGFQRIKKYKNSSKDEDERRKLNRSICTAYDEIKYQEVKKDAKCISLLLIITIVTWLLEIVTFYSPGPQNYLIVMEMINGLQGVLIMLIFIVVRRRRTVILRWWYDRGTHTIEDAELTVMRKSNEN